MPLATDAQVALIVSGLKLFQELLGQVDAALLERALRQKIAVGLVTRVPSWETTENFILANPGFVEGEPLSTYWETRDIRQSRIALMIALARHLRKDPGEEVYLFAPEVRQTPGLVAPVIAVAGAIREALENPETPSSEKTAQIADILKEALQ